MTRFTIMATLVAFGLGMTILPDVGFAAGKKQNKDGVSQQRTNASPSVKQGRSGSTPWSTLGWNTNPNKNRK